MTCLLCDGTGFALTRQKSRVSGELQECVYPCKCREVVEPASLASLEAAGVPERARGYSEAAMSQSQRSVYARAHSEVRQKNPVLLTGAGGVGKSGIAACLLRDALARRQSAAWVDVATWLRRIRDGFAREDRAREDDLIGGYLDVDFLVMDDLGAETVTDWVRTMVLAVVGGRDDAMRPTVYTSNLAWQAPAPKPGEKPIDSLESVYGDRIFERLKRCSRFHMRETVSLRDSRLPRTTT